MLKHVLTIPNRPHKVYRPISWFHMASLGFLGSRFGTNAIVDRVGDFLFNGSFALVAPRAN